MKTLELIGGGHSHVEALRRMAADPPPGRRHAIASRGNLALQGRWIRWWKDWIDRRFMRRYAPGER